VDAKDQITHDHVRRVQIYATGMARLLKLSDAEIEALRAGALLHDIGKIAVPDYILNKPGKLTAAEFDKMKIHTIAGAQILDQINFPYPLVPVVRHHHERWDGKGYPDGLAGEAIPVTARILTVVDCFDAFRQDRQYRKGMTRQEALDLLIKDRGVFYDPAIVDLFIENLPTFEAEIAAIREEEHVFKPVTVTESEAIRQATPAAGLLEEKPKAKESAYLKTILDSHQQGQEMYALFELTQKLVGIIDTAQILNIIGTQLKTVVPHDTCALFMLAEDGGTVRPAYAGGLHADIFRKHAVRPGEGVTGWTIANNKASLNANPVLDFSCLGIEGEIPQYRTMCVLPLSKGEKVYGALAVYSQGLDAYSMIYIESLERITTMAADSLHSARLYEEARRTLLTDAQTGLPNEQALPELFAQAASASTSLSLIKVSIETEASKNLLAMTEAVQKAASAIRQQLRNTDILVRLQGGTFVLLLPETDRDALCEIAARIESALPGRVSLGQAQFSADGQTLTELLAIAHARQMADLSAHQSLRQFEAAATFRPN
jgi:putative nucleotidyltransferase with HDIG domain